MVLLDNGEVITKQEGSVVSDSLPSTNDYEAPPAKGELLVTRMSLNVRVKEEEEEERENLFHSRGGNT